MTEFDLGDGLRLLNEVKTGDQFGHESHLRFAWSLLDEASSVDSAEHVANLTIRHVAEVGGNPGKYNCTATIFWIRLLAHVRETTVTGPTSTVRMQSSIGSSLISFRCHDGHHRLGLVLDNLR
jgi:hypothetical protein